MNAGGSSSTWSVTSSSVTTANLLLRIWWGTGRKVWVGDVSLHHNLAAARKIQIPDPPEPPGQFTAIAHRVGPPQPHLRGLRASARAEPSRHRDWGSGPAPSRASFRGREREHQEEALQPRGKLPYIVRSLHHTRVHRPSHERVLGKRRNPQPSPEQRADNVRHCVRAPVGKEIFRFDACTPPIKGQR